MNITLTATTISNIGTLSYVWTDGADNIIGTGQTQVITSADTYTLVATDDYNGQTDTEVITITNNTEVPVVNILPTNGVISSVGQSIILTSTSSSDPNSTYLWSPDGQTTKNISVVSGGTYSVTVTNTSNNCVGISNTSTITEDLVTPVPTVASIVGGNLLTCSINPIVLNGASSTGTNLSYSWENGGNVVIGTSSSLSVSIPDTYKLTVSGDGGTDFTTKVITQNITAPTVNITSNDGNTLTYTGQIITLTATAGLSYLWSTSATTQSINVTAGGTYTVTATTVSNGCSSIASFTVNEDISDLTVSYNSNDGLNLNCVITELYMTASVTGGVGAISYEWWNNSTAQMAGVGIPITITQAGIYQLYATDAGNGNTDSIIFEVLGSVTTSPPTAVVTGVTVLSCTGSTTMDASSSTGIGVLSYIWTNSLNNTIGTGTTQTITTSGTYKLTVINGGQGCSDFEYFTITNAPLPSVTLYSSAQIVYPGTPVTLSATIVGGTGPYTYNWFESYDATIVGGSPQSTTTIQAETGGLYYLTVTDSNGCTNTKSIGLTNGTLADTQPPTPPTSFNAYDGQYYPQISTSWVNGTDNVAITYIDIFKTVSGDPYGTNPVASVTYPNTVWVDTTTGPNVQFCYKARSRDAAGNVSIFSNEDCHTRYPLTVLVASKAGDGSISDPLNYLGYSICDSQSGPFTYTFNKASGASVVSGMQLYTVGGQLAIPGNMATYNTNYNTLGVKWVLINGTVWQVVTSTGKLGSAYSQC